MQNLIEDIENIKKQLNILKDQRAYLENAIVELKKLDDDECIIPLFSKFIKQIASKYYILEDNLFELKDILEACNRK